MPTPILYADNVIAGAILTLQPGPAATGKGAERLADSDIGLECEDTATTGTRRWHADRGLGAATPTVDTWLFTGSNYSGQLVTLESSTDNAAWTSRGTVTPAGDTTQRVLLTPFAAPRYLRWSITTPPAPVRFTEVVIAGGVSLERKPTARFTREPQMPNTVLVPSQSGRVWGVQRGARRWSVDYTLVAAPNVDRLALYDVLDRILDGVRPFWLLTAHGELRWVRLTGAVVPEASEGLPVEHWELPLHFEEELP
jgi:hypothetical protein